MPHHGVRLEIERGLESGLISSFCSANDQLCDLGQIALPLGVKFLIFKTELMTIRKAIMPYDKDLFALCYVYYYHLRA